MKRLWPCAVLFLGFSAPLFAHMCNNIYRTPDRLVVKPERDDLSIDRTDEFRVFVKNNHPEQVTNVRLSVKSDDPECRVTLDPASIRQLRPGEKAAVKVRVEVGPGAKAGRHKLDVGISADQVGFRPAGEASTEELRKVLKDDNPSPVVLACESLARRGDSAGMDWLRQTAKTRDRDMATRALRAIGKSGNLELSGAASARLTDQDGLIKGHAILALGLLGVERATIQQFAGDADEFVRTCALAALAIQGDQSVLPRLREVLKSTNQWARAAAAWGLGFHKDTAAIAVLDQLCDNGDLKIMAGEALVSIAEKHADLRTIGQPAAAVPGSGTAFAASSAESPKPGRSPSGVAVEQPTASKLTAALGYLVGACGFGFLAYVAHHRWGVRRRR